MDVVLNSRGMLPLPMAARYHGIRFTSKTRRAGGIRSI